MHLDMRTTPAQTLNPLQIKWRLSDDPIPPNCDPDHADPEFRAKTRCKIFLGFTSNLGSAGTREHIRSVGRQCVCAQRGLGGIVSTARGVGLLPAASLG